MGQSYIVPPRRFLRLGNIYLVQIEQRFRLSDYAFAALATALCAGEIIWKSMSSFADIPAFELPGFPYVPLLLWMFGVLWIGWGVFTPAAKSNALLRKMGLMTYPIYLMHTAVGTLGMVAAIRLNYLATAMVMAGIGAAIAASYCISVIEPHLRRALRHIIEKVELRLEKPVDYDLKRWPAGRSRAWFP